MSATQQSTTQQSTTQSSAPSTSTSTTTASSSTSTASNQAELEKRGLAGSDPDSESDYSLDGPFAGILLDAYPREEAVELAEAHRDNPAVLAWLDEEAGLQDRADPADEAEAFRRDALQDGLSSVPSVVDDLGPELRDVTFQTVAQTTGQAVDACLEDAYVDEAIDGAQAGPAAERAAFSARELYDQGLRQPVESLQAHLHDAPETPDITFLEDLGDYVKTNAVALSAYGIQTNDDITLSTVHVSNVDDHANADENIDDLVQGDDPNRSHYGTAQGGEVELDPRILTIMQSLTEAPYGFQYDVSEITGGGHSSTSNHYKGTAFDANKINSMKVSPDHPNYLAFMEAAQALGATEVLGPNNDPAHKDHIHVGLKR